MQALYALYEILSILTSVLVMLIIVQFVIWLLFAFNVVNTSNEFLMAFYNSINRLLEPVLRPIRNLLPQTGAIDFSPLVLIIGLQILMVIVRNIALSA